MCGWESLDMPEICTETIRRQFTIYILSSSIDPADVQADMNPFVGGATILNF